MSGPTSVKTPGPYTETRANAVLWGPAGSGDFNSPGPFSWLPCNGDVTDQSRKLSEICMPEPVFRMTGTSPAALLFPGTSSSK
jgi:hypothetical protein